MPFKITLSVLFFSFIFPGIYEIKSQNLVPNGGFEEFREGKSFLDRPRVSIWKQPSNEFYHFDCYDYPPNSGLCYNGICMYNNYDNEYLHVRLKETLTSGREYKLRMYIRLSEVKKENYQALEEIGWYLSDSSLEVKNPFNHNVHPQVAFKINGKLASTHNWMKMEANYLATGNEQYLTIGYFIDDTKYLTYVGPDGKTFHSLDELLNSGYSKREIKSSKKQFSKNLERVIEKRKKNPFSVRYYFDDICLSPANEKGEFECGDWFDSKLFEIGKTIRLVNIYFETDKALLLSASHSELERLIKILNENPNLVIQINGHTDDQGNDDYNKSLSENRAKAVVDFLTTKGIRPERLSYKGYGASKPIADNSNEEGRSKNRRVEFLIIKK